MSELKPEDRLKVSALRSKGLSDEEIIQSLAQVAVEGGKKGGGLSATGEDGGKDAGLLAGMAAVKGQLQSLDSSIKKSVGLPQEEDLVQGLLSKKLNYPSGTAGRFARNLNSEGVLGNVLQAAQTATGANEAFGEIDQKASALGLQMLSFVKLSPVSEKDRDLLKDLIAPSPGRFSQKELAARLQARNQLLSEFDAIQSDKTVTPQSAKQRIAAILGQWGVNTAPLSDTIEVNQGSTFVDENNAPVDMAEINSQKMAKPRPEDFDDINNYRQAVRAYIQAGGR